MWELWRKTNALKYEGKGVSLHRLIMNVTRQLRMLLKVRKPTLEFSFEWLVILQQLSQLKPTIKAISVLWELPQQRWVKYKTDGVSKGNPGSSSWDFCLRDTNGDLLHVEGAVIKDTNNMEAEAMAILNAARHCHSSKQDKVIIQTDSLLMQKLLMRERGIPWQVEDMIRQIWKLLSTKQV
ncbi:uncharacterized protein LOC124898584 [Capsicum annuum]|uniref:uncharacterized protein LOC124898584 n=1 Tax=Capsicum annuum TaxID=4072 RepID=UPI001FB089C8|nr:uncharacterized protein LOC124898584 [Capsicum annuum]